MKRRYTIIQIREVTIENDVEDENEAEAAALDSALYGEGSFTIRENWIDNVEEEGEE